MSAIDARLQQLGLMDVAVPETATSNDAVFAELKQLAARTELLFAKVSEVSDVTSRMGAEETDEAVQTAKVHRMVPLREAISHDPPRTMLTLPLMIQEQEGEYTPLLGRGKARITLNDLRASLMAHFEGENSYSLRWSENAYGWQLDLLQVRAQPPHNICLTMAQTSTLKGSAMVIKDMTTNGHEITPGALQDFITDVYSR